MIADQINGLEASNPWHQTMHAIRVINLICIVFDVVFVQKLALVYALSWNGAYLIHFDPRRIDFGSALPLESA